MGEALKTPLLKWRAANKPDSVHLPCGRLRSFILAINPKSNGSARAMPAGRAARSTSYLILLRGGFAMRASFQPRRWSLTPPFHHFGAGSFAPFGIRLSSLARQNFRCLFSVALSIARDCLAPSALDKRTLCPTESGLSSALRQRPVTRASLQEKFSKISGTGCVRTSCTQRCSGACRPRPASRSHPPSAIRSAAGRDGTRRTLRRE